jgi:hypothetical protein
MQALWKKALLLDNPFVSTPPMPGEEIIWADMSEQKEKLEDRIRSALLTSPSSLVLNYGAWGGGKTHAARYFSQEAVLKDLSDEADVALPLSIIANIPRGAKSVIRDIYLNLLDAIGLWQISQSLSKVVKALGRDRFSRAARGFLRSEEFVSALLLLAGELPQFAQLEMPFVTEERVSLSLKRYFMASTTSSELRDLGLSRSIESGSDMISILSAIFNLLLYSTAGVAAEYSEIIIWFDEMEEIVSLPGKEQVTLNSLIRDLTDFVPRNLTIFINFTPRSGGKIEEVSSYLTDAVWSRFRERIMFFGLDGENVERYILDLLNAPKFRPNELKAQCPDDFFPFSEDAIRVLVKELGDHTVPRYINEACSSVIEQALVRGVLGEPDARIGVDFVHEMSPQIQELLEYK